MELLNNLPVATAGLNKGSDDIFTISGGVGVPKLQVSLTGRTSNLVNELGVVVVDDADGKINGIAPGAAGYTEAALERSKVVFSAIANNPNGFNPGELNRLLQFNNGERLRFYLIRNGTTDGVRSGTTPISDVLFSSGTSQKVTELPTGGFTLSWEDGVGSSTTDFQDLVVRVQQTNQVLPLGVGVQGNPQGEVIDLRGVSGQVKAEFTVNREAAFNNYVGFYQIADINGGIDVDGNGTVDLRPGDAGYVQEAVLRRVAGIDLAVNNQGTANITGNFNGGSLFAPFMIVDGRPDAILDSNSNNDPAVFFPFLGANSGKVDHVRLLGNNTFGFEDIVGGGDKDYNDIIVKVNLSV
ncbi:MAG: DUF4114 domain-containing protein [Calothrix sp. SM1_7_51]|nr:DUF4114 domain-containing protein [Calothrix sp. SM1_7_51]